MTKTYLVTGGAGFIGSNFVHYVLQEHDDLVVVNVDKLTYAGNMDNLADLEGDSRHVFVRADICNKSEIESLFAQYAIDYVVNFAAESHVDRSIADPSVFERTNVKGTLALLECANAAWRDRDGGFLPGKRFLQVSTDEVYGSLTLDEPDAFFREDSPIEPHSPYSASKAAADLFTLAFHTTYGLPVCVTRCSNNYGPYQFPEKLIPRMLTCAINHEPLPVYGDGLNVRDWLYVEDHCRAIELVLAKGSNGEIYNIGGHNELSNIVLVKKLLNAISEKTNDNDVSEDLITYVEDRKGHDRRYAICPQKAVDALGWRPETCFEDGIDKTIEWYLANTAWLERIASGDYLLSR